MSLNKSLHPDWATGASLWQVKVTSTGVVMHPEIFEATTIREAYEMANNYISSLILSLCETCAKPTPNTDETFRNCGVCESCYLEYHA